jgi:hypothetical protein
MEESMLLRIAPPGRGKRLTVELHDGDRLVFGDKLDPLNAREVARLVGAVHGRGYQLTGEQVLALRQGGELSLSPLETTAAAAEGPRLRIVRRRRHQPAADGTVYHTLDEALAGGADADELVWDDLQRLAVLDLDYHDLPLDQRPPPFQLEALALIARPRPRIFWISKGRGLHLVYEPVDGLTAEEAAACAGLHLKQLDPKCTFEVIARTSYPPGGEIWT